MARVRTADEGSAQYRALNEAVPYNEYDSGLSTYLVLCMDMVIPLHRDVVASLNR